MITTEQIIEILKSRNGEIAEIGTDPKGFAYGKLARGDDAERPCMLVVDPIAEHLILRVCVLGIARVRPDGRALRALAKANLNLMCGCVGLDDDGKVRYQINHVCTGADETSSPEILGRLLDETVAAVSAIEKTVLFCEMLDAGVPRKRAHQVMATLFPEDETREPPSDANATL